MSTDQTGIEVVVLPIHHASLMLQFKGNAIYVDPAGSGDYSDLPAADFIFVTGSDASHLDWTRIAQLKKASTIIVAREGQRDGITVLKAGEKRAFGEIDVEAVGKNNGYVFTMAGRRFYVSGGAAAPIGEPALANLDVAFVCVDASCSKTPAEALAAIQTLSPRVVYPYHAANPGGVPSSTGKVEVRLRQW